MARKSKQGFIEKNPLVVLAVVAAGVAGLFYYFKKKSSPAISGTGGLDTPSGTVQLPFTASPQVAPPVSVPVAAIPSGKTATVITDRSFFYDAPDPSAMTARKAYVITGDVVSITGESGDFVNVTFTHHSGVTTTGWLLKSTLRV